MTANLDELFEKPDVVEIIRDNIAMILATECKNQFEMAKLREREDANDFDISILLDVEDPLQLQDEGDEIFPACNVQLVDVVEEKGSTAENKRVRTAKFFIDCYDSANFSADASRRVWKTARIIRNILESADYTYLWFREAVSSRRFSSFERFHLMEKNAESGSHITFLRMTLLVEFSENSHQPKGETLASLDAAITDEKGIVVVG